MRSIFCVLIPIICSFSALAQSPQQMAKDLVQEYESNMRKWNAMFDRAKTKREQDALLDIRPDTHKYSEVLLKRINPHLRSDWTVPYMAWLIRTHPQLTIVKDQGPGQPARTIDREDFLLRYFEEHHVGSKHAGEFVVSLLFRTNVSAVVESKKLALAEKVYLHHADKDKRILGCAAFVCGMLTPLRDGDQKTEGKVLRYLTTAARNAADVQVGSMKIVDVLNERLRVMTTLSNGKPVPLIEGVDAINKRHKISDNKGSGMLLVFWSKNIANYDDFAKRLNKMIVANKGKKFKVLGVTQDDVNVVREGIREGTVRWRNFMDPTGAISKEFSVSQLPFCYIIDSKGTIVYRGGLGGPWYIQRLSAVLEGMVYQPRENKK